MRVTKNAGRLLAGALVLAVCTLPPAAAQGPVPRPSAGRVALASAPLRPPGALETVTAIVGGTGGTAYRLRCPTRSVLTGFHGAGGQWLDWLELICTEVNADGTLGRTTRPDGRAGGQGGMTYFQKQCPAGQVVMSAHVEYGSYVHWMIVKCRPWLPAKREFDMFGTATEIRIGGGTNSTRSDGITCGQRTEPAVGIRGREGWYVDAIGFVCDKP